MIAVGVARPSAQGQAMTSTATAGRSACPTGCPATIHTTRVSSASTITTGTKTRETRSARRSTGAREPMASRTIATMRACTVSLPTPFATTVRVPRPLTVAAETVSPGPLGTGTDSPVNIDSSTWELPSRTRPSTGSGSPARTRTTSPTASDATGTSSSEPSSDNRCALCGASASRLVSASDARRRARASRKRPTRTSVTTMPAVSKYRSGPWAPCAGPPRAPSRVHRL